MTRASIVESSLLDLDHTPFDSAISMSQTGVPRPVPTAAAGTFCGTALSGLSATRTATKDGAHHRSPSRRV